MLHHDTLANYYQVLFTMKQHHHWSIQEIENLLPWEKQIYQTMLQREIEAENDRIRQRNAMLAQGKR